MPFKNLVFENRRRLNTIKNWLALLPNLTNSLVFKEKGSHEID
jgi:hypothetical protein